MLQLFFKVMFNFFGIAVQSFVLFQETTWKVFVVSYQYRTFAFALEEFLGKCVFTIHLESEVM